ncbi:MAG: hypothetical protein ACOYLH_06595 [Flavobacteriales bacterium]
MKKTLFLFTSMLFALTLIQCKKQKNTQTTKTEVAMDQPQQDKPKLVVNPLQVDPNFNSASTGDAFEIQEMKVKGDSLIVIVSYGGGCQTHEFSLNTNGAYMKSLPVQLNLTLEHKANNDMCRAYLTERLAFDLNQIRYKTGNEVKLIVNNDRDRMVSYTY